MRKLSILLFFALAVLSSCSVADKSMQSPNHHIEFYKGDFEYSPQVAAEATVVRVLGIDWSRLFDWSTGNIQDNQSGKDGLSVGVNTAFPISSIVGGISTVIPVFGERVKGKVQSYALYNLMVKNPGYDIVIYPQYETKRFIIPIFYSKRTAKVTARLARIN